jgi:hypothetical protein
MTDVLVLGAALPSVRAEARRHLTLPRATLQTGMHGKEIRLFVEVDTAGNAHVVGAETPYRLHEFFLEQVRREIELAAWEPARVDGLPVIDEFSVLFRW